MKRHSIVLSLIAGVAASLANAEPSVRTPPSALSPDAIAEKQADVWGRILRQRATAPRVAERLTERGVTDRLSKPLDDPLRESRHVKRAVDQGFPAEAFDEPALLLAYVEAKRGEYQNRMAKGWESPGQLSEPFRRMLFVDPQFVTGQIPEETIAAGHIWRLHYLRRLVHEGGDPAYIAACAATWQIKADDIAAVPWSRGFVDRVRKRWAISVTPSKQEQAIARWLEGREQLPQTNTE